MVQFGATLVAERKKEWAQFYIDYNVRAEVASTLKSQLTLLWPVPPDKYNIAMPSQHDEQLHT